MNYCTVINFSKSRQPQYATEVMVYKEDNCCKYLMSFIFSALDSLILYEAGEYYTWAMELESVLSDSWEQNNILGSEHLTSEMVLDGQLMDQGGGIVESAV